MTGVLKFQISKFYIFSAWIMPMGVFLFTSLLFLFGKPASKDVLPLIIFDTIFFSLTVFGLKNLLTLARNGLTALELNDKGINDHIFNVHVNWDNVSDIRFSRQGYGNYVSVILKDKKAPIYQTKNVLKKGVFYLNQLFYGTPIKIFPSYIKGTNSEIFNQIEAHFKAVGKQ